MDPKLGLSLMGPQRPQRDSKLGTGTRVRSVRPSRYEI